MHCVVYESFFLNKYRHNPLTLPAQNLDPNLNDLSPDTLI